MTKFEQIGINMQYDAVSKRNANELFKNSCNACCHKGIHITCDTCKIAVAHNLVIAAFDTMEISDNNNGNVK